MRRIRRWWLPLMVGIAIVAAAAGGLFLRQGGGGNAPPQLHPPPSTTPAVPRGLPQRLELGMANAPGEAAAMRATAPFAYRYQYLAGGVHDSWTEWEPDAAFVQSYIRESTTAGMIPVFSYYMLLQSTAEKGSEGDRIARGLRDRDLMTAYLADLERFFREAGADPAVAVVLHLEPDLWGFAHQQANGDDATSVAVAKGVPALDGLPANLAGLAQAVLRLRDRLAPNVLVAYHVSNWGTGEDWTYGHASDANVERIAEREASFYASLGTRFDLVFAEFSDRDAGFKAAHGDGGASWWDEADFARHTLFLRTFTGATQLPAMLWQIPYGNTKMRAMNNTEGHYQDNRVEWLLDDPRGAHLRAYSEAGVIALLFGSGAAGATDASDAQDDGVTNPPAINGNIRESLSADDDGGYFRDRAAAYYRTGPLALAR